MTIKECIDIVDNIKPNQYGTREKVQWLSFIDEIIINDVIKTHEGYDGRYFDFIGYSEDKLSVPLIVSSPYDRLYPAYLKMKIDGENGETARYNNSAAEFNTYMMEYRKYYNKNHLPLTNANRGNSTPNISSSVVSDAEVQTLKSRITKLQADMGDIKTIVKAIQDNLNGKEDISVEQIIESVVSQVNKISTVTLFSSQWEGTTSPFYQVVNIDGATENSKIDLNPTIEQLNVFHEKDVTFTTTNVGGTITVYCIGQKPANDYTIQVSITEVKRYE